MFLQSLIQKKMTAEGLSIRSAARRIGISHTTLVGFMGGQRIDMSTLEAICKWANVSVRDALGYDKDSDVNSAISAILSASPDLKQTFEDAAADLDAGVITQDDLREIVQYAAYRLKMAREKAR